VFLFTGLNFFEIDTAYKTCEHSPSLVYILQRLQYTRLNVLTFFLEGILFSWKRFPFRDNFIWTLKFPYVGNTLHLGNCNFQKKTKTKTIINFYFFYTPLYDKGQPLGIPDFRERFFFKCFFNFFRSWKKSRNSIR